MVGKVGRGISGGQLNQEFLDNNQKRLLDYGSDNYNAIHVCLLA